MALNAGSFFAGVGTVLATIVVGFGAGIYMTDAFVGKAPREPNRLERQAGDDHATSGIAEAAAASQAQTQEQVDASKKVGPAMPTTPQPLSQVSTSATPHDANANVQQAAVPAEQAGAPFDDSGQNAHKQNKDARAEARDADVRKAERLRARAERQRRWAERRRQRDEQLNAVADQLRRQDDRGQDRPMFVERDYRPDPQPFPFFHSGDNWHDD